MTQFDIAADKKSSLPMWQKSITIMQIKIWVFILFEEAGIINILSLRKQGMRICGGCFISA